MAAIGLDPSKHLGKDLAFMEPYLLKLKEYCHNSLLWIPLRIVFSCVTLILKLLNASLLRLYGSNVCGEGGEYETLTLDCPLFTVCRLTDLNNNFEFIDSSHLLSLTSIFLECENCA